MATQYQIRGFTAGSTRIHLRPFSVLGCQKIIFIFTLCSVFIKLTLRYLSGDSVADVELFKERARVSLLNIHYPFLMLKSPQAHVRIYREGWAEMRNGKHFVANKVSCDGFFSYNITAAILLPVDRDIWDTRPAICKSMMYERDLPSVSVVIPFHNEPLVTLMRTISSVVRRTPDYLLKEIILVDDFSDQALRCIQEQMEQALFQFPKVKLIRTTKREGSTMARIIGASYVTGDVISYLDSHVEVNVAWMEPILSHLKKHKNAVVMSVLDSISDENFSFFKTIGENHGGFNWNLEFYWKQLPERLMKERHKESDPMPSPIMPAGAFAMYRQFYIDMGLLDPHMRIWGVDDVEFSFRVWQCGGRIEIIPCSRVGHVFRKRIPYSFQESPWNVIFHNAVRTAEVAMDDFKKYYYSQASHAPEIRLNETSLLSRRQLKKDMNCKDFRWFMENINPEMPFPPEDAIYYEWLKKTGTQTCLEFDNDKFTIKDCDQLLLKQFFYINKEGHFILFESRKCIIPAGSHLSVQPCNANSTKWKVIGQSLRTDGDHCLALSTNSVVLEACSPRKDEQRWHFRYHFDWSKKLSYL